MVCHLAQSAAALSSGGQGQGGGCPLLCVLGRGAEACEERMGILATISHSVSPFHFSLTPPLSQNLLAAHTHTPHLHAPVQWLPHCCAASHPDPVSVTSDSSLKAQSPCHLPAQLCKEGGMGTYPALLLANNLTSESPDPCWPLLGALPGLGVREAHPVHL